MKQAIGAAHGSANVAVTVENKKTVILLHRIPRARGRRCHRNVE
jgi:hypothetical protein